MIRVLHILGGLGTGGTESLIMNWYRNIDRSKIQFDFLVRSTDNNYADEITALGGRIYYTASFPRYFIKNRTETKAILERREWDVIHVHGNAAMYMLPLKLAKKLGYRCRVMHSHSVKAQNPVFALVHYLNRGKISQYATCCLACSEAAGHWMYPNTKFHVIHNAVQTEMFRFDQSARSELRKELGIDDCLVLGHVGRFSKPKNHAFLLDVFCEVKKLRPDSILMLVGDGELKEAAEKEAKALGLADSVLFLGRRSDVGQLMSAMDIFVLPSLYEGLGNVLIEAQYNGLPCIVSEEAYNEEAEISSGLSKISLDCGNDVWAKHILETASQLTLCRKNQLSTRAGDYEISQVVTKLQEIYLNH